MLSLEIKHCQLKNNLIKLYKRHQKQSQKRADTWKIQLTIANNFISSIDNDGECVVHSKNNNIEIMVNDE